MNSSTLSNDPLPDKRFDFQFVNPPSGYERSKDYDAVTTREPMQNNPSVRQRLASAASNRKPCRHRFLHPSPLPLCNAASPPTRRGQQSGISGHFDLKEASHERGTHCPFS